MEARAVSSWQARPRPPLSLSRLGDEALARLVERGDERLFAALFHRYHQTLYRYCRSIVRSEADAEDVVQSVFASAFVALRDRRRDAPLRPWLFRIAHNESVSLLRRRRPDAVLADEMAGAAVPVEETAIERERLAHLVADLRELPDRQRAALVMRELNGLSHEDIGMALQCSTGAAKQTIFEARRALIELEEGRAMSCDDVCRTISDGDRRALRGRKIRAHLRGCAGCAAFAEAIPARSAELRALAPALPMGTAGLLLTRVLGHGSSGGAGRLTAGLAGKSAAAVPVAKLTAGAAIIATTAIGTAHVADLHHRAAPSPAITRTTHAAHPWPGAAAGASHPASAARPAAEASRTRHRTTASGGRVHRGSRATTDPVRHGRGPGAVTGSTAGAARAGSSGVATTTGTRGNGYGRTGQVPRGIGLAHARAPEVSQGAPAGGGHGAAKAASPGAQRSVSGATHSSSSAAHASAGAGHASAGAAHASAGAAHASAGVVHGSSGAAPASAGAAHASAGVVHGSSGAAPASARPAHSSPATAHSSAQTTYSSAGSAPRFSQAAHGAPAAVPAAPAAAAPATPMARGCGRPAGHGPTSANCP